MHLERERESEQQADIVSVAFGTWGFGGEWMDGLKEGVLRVRAENSKIE